MSNIYIQEPPTKGKVILKTSLGEITVELWSKECPLACRNFIQLCMEGYYDGTIFHRVVKDFIAQGGDPTGTGHGGESVYGAPFKDEFHSRLRFNRRGLLGMASAGKNDNGSQFFFTLGPCTELSQKHTLFAKIPDTTIYNMIKLNELELIDERPIRPERIISTEVIFNPFDDIKPRNLRATQVKDENKDKSAKVKGVKNFGLLSFGDEAEDEEEGLEQVQKEFKAKVKSAHDVGDPTLSSKPSIETNKSEHKAKRDNGSSSESDESSSETESNAKIDSKETSKSVNIDLIKSKLKSKEKERKAEDSSVKFKKDAELSEKDLKKKQTEEEIKRLEKELLSSKKKKAEEEEMEREKQREKKEEAEVVQKYKEDIDKYEHLKNFKKSKNKKEDKTLEMLNAFRERLFKAKKGDKNESEDEEHSAKGEHDEAKDQEGQSDVALYTHRLEVDEEIRQKVIDANVADNDRYAIFDPRNPLNKRKREESKDIMKERKKSHLTSLALHSKAK